MTQSNPNKVNLYEFLLQINADTNNISKDIFINNLSQNSKLCAKGDLFIALAGHKFHGIEFFSDALAKGVSYCLTSKVSDQIPLNQQIYISDLELRITDICQKFYDVSNVKYSIAITGTNGKSSIADLIYQIAKKFNFKCNSLGTIGFRDENNNLQNINLTSPDIFSFYQFLNKASNNEIDIFCFEASSHGLSQARMGNYQVDYAFFTNLSHDHLDYHENMESYYQAKKLLFTKHLKSDGFAFINIDDDYGKRLENELSDKNIVTISSYDQEADIYYSKISDDEILVKYHNQLVKLKHDFIANFQITNFVMVLAFFIKELKINLNSLIDLASSLKPIKGRLEKYKIPGLDAKIFIDFAHTPDAMENVLKDIKINTQNRLIVVFGCGGDRDKTKRSIMGDIAKKYADIVIVTDDNPRFEDAAAIRKEIIHNHQDFIEVDDRKQAIISGLNKLKKGDVLIVLGKGHEEYQLIRDQKIHFSESEIITNYFEEQNVHN